MIKLIKINVLRSYHVTNCYIIWDEKTKEAAIVDPADDAQKIIENIRDLNLKLKYVMLTHAHKDHTIALNELLKNYDIKVIASVDEAPMLEGKVNDCSDVFGLSQVPFDLSRFILLNDGECFNIGDINIKIIHTPGHTKGSACYYIEDEKILLTGDTLFSDCFGRCDLDSASIEDMANSLYNLYKNYNDVHIFPGHNLTNINIKDTYPQIKELLEHVAGVNLDELLK